MSPLSMIAGACFLLGLAYGLAKFFIWREGKRAERERERQALLREIENREP